MVPDPTRAAGQTSKRLRPLIPHWGAMLDHVPNRNWNKPPADDDGFAAEGFHPDSQPTTLDTSP